MIHAHILVYIYLSLKNRFTLL